MIVLDISVTMPLFLEDESSGHVETLLDWIASGDCLVPSIWPYEMANSFVVAERARRLTIEDVIDGLSRIQRLEIDVDEVPVSPRRLAFIATQYGLTAYDAAYLELADRTGAELATLDKQLAKAAKKLGVPLTLKA